MEPTKYLTGPRWLSILTCIAAIGVCGAAMAMMTADRAFYAQLFADFKLKLPAVTRIVVDTPDALVVAVLGLSAIASVIAVGLFRSPKRAIVLHFGVMAVTGIAMAIWEKALGQAFITLMQGITGMTGGSRSS